MPTTELYWYSTSPILPLWVINALWPSSRAGFFASHLSGSLLPTSLAEPRSESVPLFSTLTAGRIDSLNIMPNKLLGLISHCIPLLWVPWTFLSIWTQPFLTYTWPFSLRVFAQTVRSALLTSVYRSFQILSVFVGWYKCYFPHHHHPPHFIPQPSLIHAQVLYLSVSIYPTHHVLIWLGPLLHHPFKFNKFSPGSTVNVTSE